MYSYTKVAAALAFSGLVSGYSYHTECGPMNNHMFSALDVLGKTPAQLRFPKSLPYPKKPAGKDTMPEIEHVVWLMMENHSWDHVYGLLNRPGQDGLPLDDAGNPMTLVPQKYNNGSVQTLYEMPNTCDSDLQNGPSQNWESSHQQFNNGSMDGFAVGGNQDKPLAMGYLTEKHLPFFHSIGETFPINDRFFCSCLGQTWPNRMYALGASSRGIIATGQLDVANVVYPDGVIVNTLDKYDISWVSYNNGTSTFRLFPNNVELNDKTNKSFPADFMADVKAGTLPKFSFLDYNGSTQSMEPPQNVVRGDELMYDVVSNLMSSPSWNKTVLIINFDEHGGLYDHVPPVPAISPDHVAPIIPAGEDSGYHQFEQYRRTGFRVPLVMISPYSKKNHVSHVVHDQTSVLSFLEHKFNLPALTCRDANANNLFDLLDFKAMDSKTPNFPDIESGKLSPPTSNKKFKNCVSDTAGIVPAKGSVIAGAKGATGPDFSPKCIRS